VTILVGQFHRWASGEVSVGDNGSVGGWLESGRDFDRRAVDDEGGANYGEQAGLRTWSTPYSDKGNAETHKN
jgi:hypothetical protein